jgi:sugar phosphate isomerase/epimerase
MIMPTSSRRDFLKAGSAALLCGSTFLGNGQLNAEANPAEEGLGLPLGVELYSIREMLPTAGYDAPLKQLAGFGYREVEGVGWANFYNYSTSQVKQAVQNAGLRYVGAHYSYDQLTTQLDWVLKSNSDLGGSYIICSSPVFKDPSLRKASNQNPKPVFTLDDWRWNAEQFNQIGEKITAAGAKFGYHNHILEFHKLDGVVPYDELMRLTDPSKVTMEMDCGWVVVGGGDPVELLRRYPTRISLLHIKDFKQISTPVSPTHPPTLAQLGQGVIDYRPILRAAAKTGYVKHCFVEQEGSDLPIMDALKIDAEYMRKLNV